MDEKQSKSPPRWLTPPAIAEQLGVDVHEVLRWVRSGALSAVDLRRPGSSRPRYRVSPHALNDYLAGRRVQPPTPRARRHRRPPDLRHYV